MRTETGSKSGSCSRAYLPRLEANWRKLICPEDTVVLAGDTSWAMNLNDTKADFAFIQNLPGQKWLLKGNHDYWWTTTRKMETFLAANGFDTLHILHNNACIVGDVAPFVVMSVMT